MSKVFEVQVISHRESKLLDLFVAHNLEFVPAEFQDDLGGEVFSVDGFFFHGEEVKGPKPRFVIKGLGDARQQGSCVELRSTLCPSGKASQDCTVVQVWRSE